MIDEAASFTTRLKGKRVKLTLKNSTFVGVIQRVNADKTLVLADVSTSDGCKIPGSKLFFGRNVLNVEFLSQEGSQVGNSNQDQPSDKLDIKVFQPYRNPINFHEDEEEVGSISFAVIDEFHGKFGPAVSHIKRQSVIGVGAEGVDNSRNERLCWLQIATTNKVYLFDILLLGTQAFRNGLSFILESKHILKVIHDCRAIAGCLMAQFGVKLMNVFDTQVADVMCFHSETGGFLPDRISSLQEVVSLHLKVPSSRLSSLQVKSQFTKTDMKVWYDRPCPVSLLKVMVVSVIHLQPLRLMLLDTFMSDYMTLVDSYLNSSYYEIGRPEQEGVQELPPEIKQWDEMRLKRREWATGRYPVTEQGLLVRFSPLPQPSSPVTSPSSQERRTQTGRPLSVPSADTSINPSAQPASAGSRLTQETSGDCSPPAGVKGCRQDQLITKGRGRPFPKESSVPVLPSIGRGFLLDVLQTPRGSTKDGKAPHQPGSTPTGIKKNSQA
ncbi:Exonuclease 3'-5' domain-containing protein 1 [Oryzias melastigma]|uniref:Exonuclease 3'-5' domain-containing protein 1 n=1 Tax=Oryzias melastigma TaxID=30732 RepID=A0A834CLT9_ORYME|nr:Exonuclease 3'-5' domain-containing protein 1 [Oryzias melastigma]